MSSAIRDSRLSKICSYGLPSAGVLATELRHCILTNTALEPSISRSQLIRNLSLLTTSLGWVDKPDHRYYNLCRDAYEKLETILDEALNYVPKPTQDINGLNQSSDLQQHQYDATSTMEVTFPTDSENFLAWLDSVDWNSSIPTF
jgi:hypothetical protein